MSLRNLLRSATLALCLTACSGTQVPVSRPEPCVVEPPPAPPQLDRIPCEEDRVCYGREDAVKLGLWAAAIWRWAQDAYACQQE